MKALFIILNIFIFSSLAGLRDSKTDSCRVKSWDEKFVKCSLNEKKSITISRALFDSSPKENEAIAIIIKDKKVVSIKK